METESQSWVQDVLTFWFDDLSPEQWFDSSGLTDDVIRARFGGLHDQLSAELPEDVSASPERLLATVIVLDQFSRNLGRGTAKAFANDTTARDLAASAIDSGLDQHLPASHQHFLYMPFMHSEALEDQERAVSLFQGTDAEAWAVKHRDIVARFGRFPHRNDALGRASTAEEQRYLQDAERFGQ